MKQKTRLTSVILILLTTLLLLTACAGGDTAYVVTFETNGGTTINAVSVNAGESTELPVPKKDGYTFDGWFTDAAFAGQPIGKTYTPTGSATLYAKWSKQQVTPVEYVVTFETNGGGNVDEMTVESGNSIELPTPPPPPKVE